ncbi:hypothetical protein BC835DRAFT_1368167 [Cytidiella melzeri]|nr:hypothetical protein BC835DRAFT_1368167 [Cytidiella melzeri]
MSQSAKYTLLGVFWIWSSLSRIFPESSHDWPHCLEVPALDLLSSRLLPSTLSLDSQPHLSTYTVLSGKRCPIAGNARLLRTRLLPSLTQLPPSRMTYFLPLSAPVSPHEGGRYHLGMLSELPSKLSALTKAA